MLSKKLTKLITSVLITVLITLSGFCGYKAYSNHKYINTVKAQQMQQIEINKQIENWKYKLDQFKIDCLKEEKLIVLQGTANIENTFTNEDQIVKYQGNDSTIKFLLGKLNELKAKSMTVNTEYKFGFTYNIKDFMKVECSKDGELTIAISKQFVHLQYLDEQYGKTIIDAKTHIFSGKFTPQQQTGIMHITKIRTWNTINSDKDIQDKAIEGTKEAVTDIAKKFGFKKVNVIIEDSPEIIHNQEVNINNITYNK